VPLFTLKGPRDFQDHGTRGSRTTEAESASADAHVSRAVGGPRSGPTFSPQRRLPIGCFLALGELGGGSSSLSFGLSLARYDSPSTTRS